MNKSKICLLRGIVESSVRLALLITLSIVLLWPSLAVAGVQALFNLDIRSEAPFPTNWFSVPDASNNTNIRVNLPYPDCAVFVSDCEDIDVINTLDGFNLQPRLSVPFDGPIDVTTVTSETVFLISLGSTLDHGGNPPGTIVGINQVVWDPDTNTLHVESDELLAQHTRYALIVTRGVRDEFGDPVEATETFRRFRKTVRGEYKHALLEAIHSARHTGLREEDIAVASVFTTQSVTAILEKIRDQIKAGTPEPADFLLGPKGERTVFSFDTETRITWNRQRRVEGPLDPVDLNLSGLRSIPGAIGQLAFGKYRSPDYMVHPGEFIPAVGSATGTPQVQGANEIYFNIFVPAGPPSAGGWPVAIFGHGGRNHKQGSAFNVAATMAAHGIATIAINTVGHGFGPLGTLSVNRAVGGAVTFAAGGRGIDQDGDGAFGENEGVEAAAPLTIIGMRDGFRQTMADLMQLVRVIEVGIDLDDDGLADLDSERIYYFGQSQGGNVGTIFLGVEPAVRTGLLNVSGGSLSELRRFQVGQRPSMGIALDMRTPSLLNPPGLTQLDGIALSPPYFNENKPLRHEPLVINTVPGAIAIQTWLEHQEWAGLSGDPLAYAPHLRKAPLAGMPAKSVLYQFAKGDQAVTNPITTALLRAGDLADRATFYRTDLAVAEDPTVLRSPHLFMTQILNPHPLVRETARGAQEQIAIFFASDGTVIIHPEPARFFEVPIVLPLPERLNFIP